MKVDVLFAHDEEIWDRITGTSELPPWTEATTNAIDETKAQINAFDTKTKATAEGMWNVVLAERALAEEEAAMEKPEQQPEQQHEQQPEPAPSLLSKLARKLKGSDDTTSPKE